MTISFFIRGNRLNKENKAPIYVRIIVDGVREQFSLNKWVEPERWNGRNGTVSGRTNDIKALNEFLNTVKTKFQKIESALLLKDEIISAKSIKSEYLGEGNNQKTFGQLFSFHQNNILEQLSIGQISKSTIKRFETAYTHFINLLQHNYGIDDIKLSQLNLVLINEFDHYLRIQRKCNNNSTVKYVRNIRKVVRFGISRGWLDNDPFLGYNGKIIEMAREFLSEHELALLEGRIFSNIRLEEVRDCFVFCCYTAFSYADLIKLKPEDITTDDEGNPCIINERTKTGTEAVVLLLPKALELIEKYKDHPKCIADGTLVPVISNQKYNTYLKEVAMICGIAKNITSHTARHTCGCYLVNNDIPLESAQKHMGHKNIRTTQHYAKISKQKVFRDMQVLNSRLKAN